MKRRDFLKGAAALALAPKLLGNLPAAAAPAPAAFVPFAEGTFLHLDGGTLELGLVRDSVLNARNDYTIFAETFMDAERVALVTTGDPGSSQP